MVCWALYHDLGEFCTFKNKCVHVKDNDNKNYMYLDAFSLFYILSKAPGILLLTGLSISLSVCLLQVLSNHKKNRFHILHAYATKINHQFDLECAIYAKKDLFGMLTSRK